MTVLLSSFQAFCLNQPVLIISQSSLRPLAILSKTEGEPRRGGTGAREVTNPHRRKIIRQSSIDNYRLPFPEEAEVVSDAGFFFALF
jgi:hypothetical protein